MALITTSWLMRQNEISFYVLISFQMFIPTEIQTAIYGAVKNMKLM